MNKNEIKFKGLVVSGFLVVLICVLLIVVVVISGVFKFCPEIVIPVSSLLFCFLSAGFLINEPNNARVFVFFGKYSGTFKRTGFFWVNPFYQKKKITLRARNLDVNPIKVNDKAGNPIMIGMVLIWKISDTYKAVFEIDSTSLSAQSEKISMQSFEKFVAIQSDAALREVAGKYEYDNNENNGGDSTTLRSGGSVINQHLETELNERLQIAGIEVVEARINNLAYAPEIAAVMLRRQQATAIISAREKIVEGAVGMVELALRKLSEDGIVQLDEDKKAAMVSNLLVVLCADEAAQPVLNTGSLYQ